MRLIDADTMISQIRVLVNGNFIAESWKATLIDFINSQPTINATLIEESNKSVDEVKSNDTRTKS